MFRIKFELFLVGMLVGALLVFSIFYFKNENMQNNSSIIKTTQLKNQTIVNVYSGNSKNCYDSNYSAYIINLKLGESLNLINQTINLTEVKKQYQNQPNSIKINQTPGLLSPRVYAGVLEPRSFLITNFDPLRKEMINYLAEQNINASIYVENLRNGANFGIHENMGYFPASLNKLPVAILVMQKIEDGRLTMDTLLPIKEYERTDTFGTLYLTKEKELTVRDLIEHMLKESDNTAFNVLFDSIDRGDLIHLLDYYNIKENTEYPFKRAEYGGYTDLVTPIQLYNIFSSLYLSTVLYAPDSEYILSLLTNTTDFDTNYEASIPQNVSIADKFGEYYVDDSKLFHDCGIIYIDQSRIFFCIMMRDIDVDNAKAAVGYFVNHIYSYVTSTRTKLDGYKQSLSSSNSVQGII